MNRILQFACGLAALSVAVAGTPALADDFPSRPVRIISGLPAGTAGDITARVIGARMSQILGQQIVVENRTGAGSSLGAAAVARSANDGYTLFVGAIANVINATMNPNLTFDLEKDFSPIALLTTTPLILVVHPSLGVKTVAELVELAKAKPESVAFASSGPATTTHLSIELLKLSGGLKIVHVPYTGSPQAVTDLLAGRIQGYFSPASTVMEHVRAGKLIALASTEAKRTASAPDLPTMIESGWPGFEAGIWSGLLAPAGTPHIVIEKLSRAANEAIQAKDVVQALQRVGIDPIGSSPEAFGRYINSELKRWTAVVAHAGLKK
jgi:tripartite-type tricarboxylate transporter receptor subunit TctC